MVFALLRRARGRLKLILLTVSVVLFAAAVRSQNPDDAVATAQKLLQLGKNAEAISLLKDVAAKHPERKGVNHALGVAYYREGEYLQASKFLQDAWDENKNDRDAAQLLGLSFYFSGRPGEAIPALETVHEGRPDANIDANYILALCYAAASRPADARRLFARLYGVSPDSPAAHLLLARMLLRQGFDVVAEREARAALLTAPQLPLAHLTMGELAIYGGDYPRAVAEFQSELALNPACAPALTHLGDLYWRLGRDEDSQTALLHSISLDPTVPEPYVALGKVLLREGHIVLAHQNLRRALDRDSGSYTAHYVLGQLYRDQGQLDAAQREMAAAARIQQAQGANPGRN